eukprot:1196297-Prorocentrum_minimum.AAC.5
MAARIVAPQAAMQEFEGYTVPSIDHSLGPLCSGASAGADASVSSLASTRVALCSSSAACSTGGDACSTKPFEGSASALRKVLRNSVVAATKGSCGAIENASHCWNGICGKWPVKSVFINTYIGSFACSHLVVRRDRLVAAAQAEQHAKYAQHGEQEPLRLIADPHFKRCPSTTDIVLRHRGKVLC